MKILGKLFFISVFMILLIGLVGCGETKSQKVSEQQPKEVQTTQETKVAETSKTENAGEYIPGLAAADVKLNLEKRGFKFTDPKPLKEYTGYLDEGKTKDPDTGLELSCTISADDPTKVKSVIFRADGTLAAGTISENSYLSMAKSYLGFCATMPYDGADPEKARQWVEENINNVKQNQSMDIKIGLVKYRLAGNSYFRLLTIKNENSAD